jgi:glycosyltransferase involved in cell wall biosynthesis
MRGWQSATRPAQRFAGLTILHVGISRRFYSIIVHMGRSISVVIPNYNGARSIGSCLEALFASSYDNFEVVVVDDCSSDDSPGIIRRFPCRLVTLEKQSGAARARNIGAQNSGGEVLFFIDADCIVQRDTLARVDRSAGVSDKAVIGGTYTRLPEDDCFFSTFQSVFIHYSETKRERPDYIASHAMAIRRELFEKSGGFPETFMPIIEDVEFSHRLRRSGSALRMDPSILVSHSFDFTLTKSLRNAFRKSMYWTAYSLKNRDLLKDSGTASKELKTNVAAYFSVLFICAVSLFFHRPALISCALPVLGINAYINRNFFALLRETKGGAFAFFSALYYLFLYPLPVGAGSVAGAIRYSLRLGQIRGMR